MHSAKSDIHYCTDSNSYDNDDLSGKTFVNGALNGPKPSIIYEGIAAELALFGRVVLGLDNKTMPRWIHLTRWVCYVSKDNHRGCLIMAKGLCAEDKSWLGQITDLKAKISSILAKAKNAVSTMFKDTSISSYVTNAQKESISDWLAQNYLSRLVNNSNNPQYQLDSCCEGDACNNFAFTIQKPRAILMCLFILYFILI